MDLNVYLKELEQLVNIDSCSDDPEGVARVASFFAERFQELGWIVEVHDFANEGGGPCVICRNREAEHYDMFLIGHIDTVFPKGTCAERPFRVEGDRAYGPGVADMKDGSLLMYYLMKDLPAELNEKLNIVAVFNPDEEIGSRYSKTIYLPYAAKSDYAFLYEARGMNKTFCTERKGACSLTAEFFGIAGHCGYAFTNGGRSAISEMARWIVALDALQSRERNTTVNVGVANGGTKSNVIPDYATISASIRFSDPAEETRIRDTVAQLEHEAKERGIDVAISWRCKTPLVPSEKAKAYFEHLKEVGAAHGVDVTFEARGGLSDANIIAPYGPICIDGMGPAGGKGHSREEFMFIPSVQEVYDFSMMVFRDLASNK